MQRQQQNIHRQNGFIGIGIGFALFAILGGVSAGIVTANHEQRTAENEAAMPDQDASDAPIRVATHR